MKMCIGKEFIVESQLVYRHHKTDGKESRRARVSLLKEHTHIGFPRREYAILPSGEKQVKRVVV